MKIFKGKSKKKVSRIWRTPKKKKVSTTQNAETKAVVQSSSFERSTDSRIWGDEATEFVKPTNEIEKAGHLFDFVHASNQENYTKLNDITRINYNELKAREDFSNLVKSTYNINEPFVVTGILDSLSSVGIITLSERIKGYASVEIDSNIFQFSLIDTIDDSIDLTTIFGAVEGTNRLRVRKKFITVAGTVLPNKVETATETYEYFLNISDVIVDDDILLCSFILTAGVYSDLTFKAKKVVILKDDFDTVIVENKLVVGETGQALKDVDPYQKNGTIYANDFQGGKAYYSGETYQYPNSLIGTLGLLTAPDFQKEIDPRENFTYILKKTKDNLYEFFLNVAVSSSAISNTSFRSILFDNLVVPMPTLLRNPSEDFIDMKFYGAGSAENELTMNITLGNFYNEITSIEPIYFTIKKNVADTLDTFFQGSFYGFYFFETTLNEEKHIFNAIKQNGALFLDSNGMIFEINQDLLQKIKKDNLKWNKKNDIFSPISKADKKDLWEHKKEKIGNKEEKFSLQRYKIIGKNLFGKNELQEKTKQEIETEFTKKINIKKNDAQNKIKINEEKKFNDFEKFFKSDKGKKILEMYSKK